MSTSLFKSQTTKLAYFKKVKHPCPESVENVMQSQ